MITSLVCELSAGEEIWPEQPNPPLLFRTLSIFSKLPPYEKGEVFTVKNRALFFKKRSILDLYLKDETRLDTLVQLKEIQLFENGRKIKASQDIVSYAGSVIDDDFGDGYVILLPRL